MRNKMRTVPEQIYFTGTIYQSSSEPVSTPKERNLGVAIVLAAIRDYRSMDEQARKDAKSFFTPKRLSGKSAMTGRSRWPRG